MSYVAWLDFSAAFDRVSHSSLIYELKSLGVSGRVLDASEWMHVVTEVPKEVY